MAAEVPIGRRTVGAGHPVFVIAEAGVNHDGRLADAHRLVAAAAAAGADAVKFQTFDPDALVTAAAPKAEYQQRAAGGEGAGQREMLRALTLPREAWAELKTDAEDRGLEFISTPFDEGSLELLLELGVPAIKVSSGDLTNTLLLRAIAASGRPAILSTGMSTPAGVGRALLDLGAAPAVVLHCVSAYPAPVEESNLRVIPVLARLFGRPVGFSDHTIDADASVAAVALGAVAIEKHLTLDRARPGPDHAASLDPGAFSVMTASIRNVERALGAPVKRPAPSEADVMSVGRRSLVAARPVRAGEVLDLASLAARRPAGGIPPTEVDRVLGRRARHDLAADQAITWSDLELG